VGDTIQDRKPPQRRCGKTARHRKDHLALTAHEANTWNFGCPHSTLIDGNRPTSGNNACDRDDES